VIRDRLLRTAIVFATAHLVTSWVTSDLYVAWPVTVALWAGFVVLFDGVASAIADMRAGERP
jgi:hypothetical protein